MAGGVLTPHKLPRVIGSLPSTTQAQPQYDNSDENGQCYSSDIYQQARKHTISCVVSVGIDNFAEWSLQRNIFLVAEYLPGKENVAAGQKLRLLKDHCDWMLNPQVFSQIQQVMGPLQIDLFASHLTKQLPTFYSWKPDQETQGRMRSIKIGLRGGDLPTLHGA